MRSVVVVTIDTVRWDRMGSYGYFRDTTPQLDRLAKEALLFTACRTPIAQTTPSHTSLFTGVLPYEHGVMSNHTRRAAKKNEDGRLESSEALRTLAELYRARGMKTGGFVGATPVKSSSGLAAGFEVWTEPRGPRRPGAEVISDALRFLERWKEQPFFVWIHLFDAHEPLVPPTLPDAYAARYADGPELRDWLAARGFPDSTQELERHGSSVVETNNRYDGALRYLDDQLEPLFERLRRPDLLAATALVVVSDHGTSNGQHSHMGHGTCWDEQFRVPLLVRVPGVEPRVVDVPTSLVDVWPTLFGLAPPLADAGFLAQCSGHDVLADDHDPRPFVGTAARKPAVDAITHGRWKLLREVVIDRPAEPGGAVQRRIVERLFDLEADPHELENVLEAHPEVAERLRRLLAEEVARQKKRGARLHGGGVIEPVDPKTAGDLERLGYPNSSGDASDEDDHGSDPGGKRDGGGGDRGECDGRE